MNGWVKIAVVAGLWMMNEMLAVASVQAADTVDVKTRAERSFDQLKHHQEETTNKSSLITPTSDIGHGTYASDHYWIGHGQGDLTKGRAVCQRVSELSARTDLAKQIRVLVKEHLTDRVRERSGRESEQDIELTREEIVQEYLQDVKIVDRLIDEENKVCSAIAVMPKHRVQVKPAPDQEPTPAALP